MKRIAYTPIFHHSRSLWAGITRLLLVVLLSLFLSTPTSAENRSGSYSASPLLGGFLFEGNQDLKHRPVFGVRLGYDFTVNWGAEAVFDYVSTRHTVTDSNADVLNYRIEGLYHFMPNSRMVPYLAAGVGGMSIDSRNNAIDRNRAVLDYGAGVKYFLAERIALRADVRHILAFGSRYNNLEYALGVVFYFGGPKAVSARAVPEIEQAQTTEAAPAETAGSAAATASNIPETIKLTAMPVSSSQIALGWNAPTGAAGFNVYRDGSLLSRTKMLSEYDTGLMVDTRYCYRVSALNLADTEFSTSNEACAATFAAQPPKPATATAPLFSEPYALEDIHFDFDKFNLKPEARAILKRHAEWMIKNSDVILTILVEGHCDERGTAEYNLALGQRRADAAAKYLIDMGVDAGRIKTISYGFERPVDPRHNEEAWAKNRRAHFVVTDKGGLEK